MLSSDEELFEQEWALTQVLQNPVLFREFINEDDPNWKPLEEHERAWSTCDAHFLEMCCGRSVRKTTTLIEMLYYWMVNELFVPGDPGLFVLVPNKAQKELAFFRIRTACLTHWLIKQYVNPNNINITDGRIDFINGFQLLLRIAGAAGSEANVIGVHTFRIWVDEAQDFPWRTWLSLQNCLKPEIDGYQMIVSGVPNGGRKDNVLYECDALDEKYVKFNVPQNKMSWWNPELEVERRRQYHATQEDSEDYKHYVLGQHGVPVFSVFSRERFVKENFEPFKFVITQHMLETTRRPNALGELEYHIEEVVICPPLDVMHGIKPRIGVGYDVGFSPDPGVFFVMWQDSNTGAWRSLVRFVLQRVEYGLQRKILAWLDTVYKFEFIGIDMGGPGKVQYQDLTGELNEYKEYNFLQRIFPVEFGSWMTVAVDENGVEKKSNVKNLAVETLSRWVQQESRFIFADSDNDLMEELERTKFMRTVSGEPVYKTIEDHQMAAFMCAVMAYEHFYGPPVLIAKEEIRPRLIGPHWLEGVVI